MPSCFLDARGLTLVYFNQGHALRRRQRELIAGPLPGMVYLAADSRDANRHLHDARGKRGLTSRKQR